MKKKFLNFGKTTITVLVILLLAKFIFANITAFDIEWWNQKTYSNLPSNTLRQWAEGMEGRVGMPLGTGHIFYVDSAVINEGDGSSWLNAKDTLDEAVNLCENSRGDVIYVAQGHAETFLAQSLDCDVIGVTIIGCGSGSLRPTITYGHTSAEVAIGADNVTIMNMRFISSVTGVLMGIEVEDGVDYFTIRNCEFTDAGDDPAVDEFVEAINFVNGNIGCTIDHCVFTAKAAGAASAIMLDADTDQLTISNCIIRGDYGTACINGDTTASTNLFLLNNIIVNGSLVADGGLNAEPAIELLDSTAGLCNGNVFAADVATGLLIRVADDMTFIDNWIADSDGDDKAGATESTSGTITVFVDGG